MLAAAREPGRTTKELLLEMSMHLEHMGLDAAAPNVLLACFQEARHLTPATQVRFSSSPPAWRSPAPLAWACR